LFTKGAKLRLQKHWVPLGSDDMTFYEYPTRELFRNIIE
jgi:hypothetical protein